MFAEDIAIPFSLKPTRFRGARSSAKGRDQPTAISPRLQMIRFPISYI